MNGTYDCRWSVPFCFLNGSFISGRACEGKLCFSRAGYGGMEKRVFLQRQEQGEALGGHVWFQAVTGFR